MKKKFVLGVLCVSMILAAGIGAVSYTHLDVYKRQVYKLLRKGYSR